jgi:hypothetical protein
MPNYQYRALDASLCPFADCGGRFEEVQDIGAPALDACPVCSAPCRKVISAPSIKRHDRAQSGALNDAALARQGFLQYKKAGQGVWERTVGTDEQGPRILKKDGSSE